MAGDRRQRKRGRGRSWGPLTQRARKTGVREGVMAGRKIGVKRKGRTKEKRRKMGTRTMVGWWRMSLEQLQGKEEGWGWCKRRKMSRRRWRREEKSRILHGTSL